jgi:flavin-dependent dehydrogenase
VSSPEASWWAEGWRHVAVVLRQAGTTCFCGTRARFPRDKVCGEGVSPEAWRLLAAMGRRGASRAPARARHELTAPDGTAFTGEYAGARAAGFAVRRWCLDRALLDCARSAGVEVREGVRARDLVTRDGIVRGVMVEGAGVPERLEARLVVAADGRRSVIARKLGLLREHRMLRKFAVRGYWKGVEGLTDHGEMHVTRGGYCGIAPLGDGEANITFVLDQAEMGPAGGGLADFYLRTLGRWPRLGERLERAGLTSPPRAIGPLALEARRVSAPGAVLVGDAAGFYDPFTGEGDPRLARRGDRGGGGIARSRTARRPPSLRPATGRRHAGQVPAQPAAAASWPGRRSPTPWPATLRGPDLADRLVGIAGDFVPARTAMGAGFLYELLKG